jgi:diaminopimelate epimerase
MSILRNFIKYQSLGNDFIIFDWYKKPSTFMQLELSGVAWQEFVTRICDRHYGVGADGVLIITGFPQTGMPEMLIFNADGSQAENCLNGLRCVAHHLFATYNFPEHFLIKVGTRVVDCSVCKEFPDQPHDIITRSSAGAYEGEREIVIAQEVFKGHIVSVGNPHFVIMSKKDEAWVRMHGAAIESHESFPHKTNVEFIWQLRTGDPTSYEVLVFERGCGITLACGSGASVIVGLLAAQNVIAKEQKITLHMQGGKLIAWLDTDGSVVLQASAEPIFSGTFQDHLVVSKVLSKDVVAAR